MADVAISGKRDTSPLRPHVRRRVLWLLYASPEGVTVSELRTFLVTRRPASRDTIARVMQALLADGLVHITPEPAWRRRARARLAGVARRPLRGRTHVLFTPTRALSALLRAHPEFDLLTDLPQDSPIPEPHIHGPAVEAVVV